MAGRVCARLCNGRVGREGGGAGCELSPRENAE